MCLFATYVQVPVEARCKTLRTGIIGGYELPMNMGAGTRAQVLERALD